MVGRAIRPYKGKDAWVIDLCGTYRKFGNVAELEIGLEAPNTQKWCVTSRGKQLTNVMF